MGSDDEFIETLVKHFKEQFPELAEEYKNENLRAMIRGGIERAKSHGFSTAQDLTAFVSIMFEVAPNFDEQAEIRTVLDDKKFQPADRLENIWSNVVPKDVWEKAADNCDEEAWTMPDAN